MSDVDFDRLPLLDDEIIAELREVMEDEFADLLRYFLNDLPGQLDRLQEAVERGDLDQLYKTAHRFKSSCGSIGALRLAELMRLLEEAGRERRPDDIRGCLRQARAVAAETTPGLRALLA
jgi:HPt (histidine-containing phosphotransfer) domain-containing protein